MARNTSIAAATITKSVIIALIINEGKTEPKTSNEDTTKSIAMNDMSHNLSTNIVPNALLFSILKFDIIR